MAGPHTLAETERAVQTLLSDMSLDFDAMAVMSNLFRAANAVRNNLERTVLQPHDLTWTAFVVLWVVWVWDPIETRDVAAEVGVSKATVSGVLATLERRDLLRRERGTADRRLVLVRLTPAGRRLMRRLFPRFNAQEQAIASALTARSRSTTADALRRLARTAANED